METAFWLGDKQYVAETATAEEKAELKAANIGLYNQYFKDTEIVESAEVEEVIPEVVVKRTMKK